MNDPTPISFAGGFMRHLKLVLGLLVLGTLQLAGQDTTHLTVPYTRFVLPNGLNVIVHEDHSTPMVSVNMRFNVGSAREKPGRTGFAHLFEHRSEEHTSELQSQSNLVCRLLLEKKKKKQKTTHEYM